MARIRTWFWPVSIGAFPAAGAADTVVLLHGLGRGPASMHRMAAALERDGHEVRNAGYASTRGGLSVLADAALGPVFAGEGAAGGKVSVERTHLAGERDHVVVKASRTWLMWRRAVIGRTRTFLREGRFADQTRASARARRARVATSRV